MRSTGAAGLPRRARVTHSRHLALGAYDLDTRVGDEDGQEAGCEGVALGGGGHVEQSGQEALGFWLQKSDCSGRLHLEKPRTPCLSRAFCGADDGIRTRDPNLGKVVLYQLSYVRVRGRT